MKLLNCGSKVITQHTHSTFKDSIWSNMSTESSNSIVRAFEQTIAEGEYAGRTFRYTNDVPRKSSVIDWIALITGLNSKSSAQILRRIIDNNSEVASIMKQHVFPGQGQRATPVATAANMLNIIGMLPSKYIGSFERERNNLLTRYLGGDTSLCAEVQDLRAAQSNMAARDPDNPLRLFGEAVESGQVGKYIDERSEARAKSIEAYHEQVEVMRSNSATNNATSYVYTNAQVSRAALGMFPCEFRRIAKIKKRESSRNYMDEIQLKSVAYTASLAASIASKSTEKEDYDKRVEEMSEEVFKINEKYGVHGYKKVQSLPKPIICARISN